jgi:hypothetical protein
MDKIDVLIQALERIRDATPASTNSQTALSMASWTQAVAGEALHHMATPRPAQAAPVELPVDAIDEAALLRARSLALTTFGSIDAKYHEANNTSAWKLMVANARGRR